MITSTRQRRWRRLAPVAAASVILTACGSSAESSDDDARSPAATDPTPSATEQIGKSGPTPAGQVVLQLVTAEPIDRPGGQIVDLFVQTVAELSNGTITIEPTYGYPGTDELAWEQIVIEAMQSGEFDLSLVRAGAWESAGVTEMRALQLPGVFRNDDQVDAVTTAPVADEILAGLAAADSVGLGLYPSNLRHLAVYAQGPLTAESLHGARLRVPLQPTVYDWMSAAGAEPVDLTFAGYEGEVRDGTLDGSDVSLAIRNNVLSGGSLPAVITGNVPMYAKFDVLAMSSAAATMLGADDVAVLREAAEQVLPEAISSRPREVDLAESACTEGMIIDSALEGTLDDIASAAQSVIDEVAADPVAGPILSSVRETVGAGTVEALPICAGAALDDPADLTADAGDLPNGVYRGEITQAMVDAVGLPESECLGNCGVYTWTFNDGQYDWTVDWPTYPPAEIREGECCWQEQSGIYEVRGDTIYMEIPWLWDADRAFVLAMRWRVNADESLSFTYVDGSPKWEQWFRLFAGPTWLRIGDV